MLKEKNIEYKLLTHEPCFTSQQSADVRGVDISTGAKALFIINKKKKNDPKYFLVVMSALK